MTVNKSTADNDRLAVYVVTHGPECTWLNGICHPLEIGAACRGTHCCDLRDDSSLDNISKKDRLFCELTGLYWIWKNDSHEYVGLYHYRRVFSLSSKKILKYLSKYDIVLPKKIPIYPNLDEEFAYSKIPLDWEVCKSVLHDISPEYYQTLLSILSEKKQYAYSMFITNAKDFNEYCSWLFPILFEIEKRMNEHASERQAYHEAKISSHDMEYLTGSYERAIGYIAERLLNLFVIHNALNVKEVNIYYPKPYNPISSKSPKIFRKIMGKCQISIRMAIYMQGKFGWLLHKFLK